MRRRKPQGWPDLMVTRTIKSGVSYYWVAPSWAVKKGFPTGSEALGSDYGAAKLRCDQVLNPQYQAWRTRTEAAAVTEAARTGTFDWLVSVYKSSPKYRELPAKTRKSYDAALALVSKHPLKDGRLFGVLAIRSLTPGVADALFAKLKLKADGTERLRTAILSMRTCQRAWNVAHRSHPTIVSAANPFAKMGLTYKAKPTRPVTHDELLRFVNAADDGGEASIGTAAMIAFFWLQREVDILTRLSWSNYRPADAPEIVRIFHHKTRELIDIPLFDHDGSHLWPEITERLDATKRQGTLIVMRDQPDRRRKVHLPWKEDYFRHRVAAIRAVAGIDPEAKFMGLRHGGNTEGADAELTDAQLRALSGHRTANMTVIYARETMKQRREGARKRRDARTEKGNLSK